MDNDVIDACYAHLFADTDFKPGYDVLIDLKDAQGSPRADQIRERARRSSTLKPLLSGRIAMVCANHDVHFGMGRMYAVFAQEFGITAKVFTSMEEAEQWLEEERSRPAIH